MDALQRKLAEVVPRIDGHLPAVFANALTEIAVFVEQADAHQRQMEVAGGFEVIPRQHAQAAGVDGQAFRETVFRGKIGQGLCPAQGTIVRPRRVHVGVKGLQRGVVQTQVGRIGGQCFQSRSGCLVDGRHGIVMAVMPFFGVQFRKEGMTFGMPAPPEIAGQLAQAGYGLGQARGHGKGVQIGRGGHGRRQHTGEGAAILGAAGSASAGLGQGHVIRLRILGEKILPCAMPAQRTRRGPAAAQLLDVQSGVGEQHIAQGLRAFLIGGLFTAEDLHAAFLSLHLPRPQAEAR